MLEIEEKPQFEEEWPDVIGELESHEEYGRVSDAIGELTSALIFCNINGILTPGLAKSVHTFLSAVVKSLEDVMIES